MTKWRIVTASVVMALAGPAIAQYDYHYVKVYYSDHTRTVGVGQETMYCNNQVERSGIETEYYRYYNGMCP